MQFQGEEMKQTNDRQCCSSKILFHVFTLQLLVGFEICFHEVERGTAFACLLKLEKSGGFQQ